MRPATGAPQRAREQARRIPVKTLAGGIQAEHGIAEELEPVKWFLRRPGSAWWSGAARGGRRPASGDGVAAAEHRIGVEGAGATPRVFVGLAGFCSLSTGFGR